MKGRWTEKRALAATQRRIAKINRLCIEIAGLWSEEDEYIISLVDDLHRHAEEVLKEAHESTAARIEERASRESEEAERGDE